MQVPDKASKTIQEHSAEVIAEIRAENDAKRHEQLMQQLRATTKQSQRLKSHFQAQRMIRRAEGGK